MIVIGGTIGSIMGLKIKMTAMPQLVAAFHSLVGLAAVLVAAGAFFSPERFGIVYGLLNHMKCRSLISARFVRYQTFRSSKFGRWCLQ